MKSAILALSLALLAAPAVADVPPATPAPAPAEIDTTAASTAASLFAPGTIWALSVDRSGDVHRGDLVIFPGNRFTLAVTTDSNPGAVKTGGGVWGIVEAHADGVFVVSFVALELEEDGEYDADEALSFRFKTESEGVLRGVLLDGDVTRPATLTRR